MAFLGSGIIVLSLVWAMALAVSVALTRYPGTLSFAGVAVLAIALLLTVVLAVKYKRDQELKLELEREGSVVYDYSTVGRYVVLAVTGTSLLAGFCCVFLFHVTVPRTASRLPPWNNLY